MAGKKRKHLKLWIILGAAAAAAAVFFLGFYVTNVKVTGNTRFTETQIKEMSLTGMESKNSILMTTLRKRIRPDAAFIDYIDVKYVSHNTIHLEVHEKYPVGYLSDTENRYYFDKTGTVLEVISEADAERADSDSGNESVTSSSSVMEESVASDSSSNASSISEISSSAESASGSFTLPTEAKGAESDNTGSDGYDQNFQPALNDVPLITGFSTSGLKNGSVIKTKNKSIFMTILSLSKIIDRLDIHPDEVAVASDQSITLYYGNIRILLGQDSDLEEKMARAKAILPQLQKEKLEGELHLEDYDKDTTNIIFDKDQTDEENAE